MVYKAQELILTERINHQLNFNPSTSPAFAKSMKLKVIWVSLKVKSVYFNLEENS
jgi:hypothetical protein